jgi:hypothetical protein
MVGVDLLVEHGGEDLSHADGSLREHRLTDQDEWPVSDEPVSMPCAAGDAWSSGAGLHAM